MNAVYSTQKAAEAKQWELYCDNGTFSHVEQVRGGWLVRRPKSDSEKQRCRTWRLADRCIREMKAAGVWGQKNLVC